MEESKEELLLLKRLNKMKNTYYYLINKYIFNLYI